MSSNASAQLHAIAAAMRASTAASARELTVGLRLGAQPLIPAVRASAAQRLPHSGGLAARVAGEPIKISVLTGARNASVRIRTTSHDSRATNSGYVRHPVYGRPNSWVRQEIPQAAGWWDDPLKRDSPSITPILLAVMEKQAARIRAV